MNQITKIMDNEGKEIKLELINKKEEIKRNEQNKIIFRKHRDGTIEGWDYDECGRLTWRRYKDGGIARWMYDKEGRTIKHEYLDGTIEESRKTHHKYADGTVEEWKYDKEGIEIWHKDIASIYWINGKPYKKVEK